MKEQIEEKNCKECLHFEACCKWTDFPKQVGFPVCRKYRNQEWISVDERLPDNYRCVLVACEGTTIGGAAPIAIGSYGGGFWSLSDADGIGYLTKYMHVIVTHWMPLPEAPKGGKQ